MGDRCGDMIHQMTHLGQGWLLMQGQQRMVESQLSLSQSQKAEK